MKLTKLAYIATVSAVALACNAKAEVLPFPLVKLTISGTVSYNLNSPTNTGTTTKSSLTTVKITTQSLINLLNASPTVVSNLIDVTATNQIPPGSYFLFDLNNQTMIVTNKSGFHFMLDDLDPSTTEEYDYGDLFVGVGFSTFTTNIIGSFSQKTNTLSGSESDLAGIQFYFNDSNGNTLSDFGNGTLKWSFGNATTNNVQKTTLSVSFPAPNGDGDMVNFNKAIAQNIKASGSGTGNVPTGIFPFYIWWAEP